MLRAPGMAARPGLDAVVVGAARTAVGAFLGALATVPAVALGATAIRAVLLRAGTTRHLSPPYPHGPVGYTGAVDECIMGNVLGAGVGQAPARQAALAAGLAPSTVCTTVNKVCASGLKAVAMACQSIQLGQARVAVAGGMESMSRAPYYLDAAARRGLPLGGVAGACTALRDGILCDGLWDPTYQAHMGTCAEHVARAHGIGRAEQDAHARESYARALRAIHTGQAAPEIAPVSVGTGTDTSLYAVDEECARADFDKMPRLRPVFDREHGTITAANASSLGDGAAAVLLMEAGAALALGARPLARVLAYADAETDPRDFALAPALAVPKALARCGLAVRDVALFEINEAFSAVVRVNERLLGLDPATVNVAGGAVALGHPLGASGCRILVTLLHRLQPGQIGVAAVCNGGGGATAMVLERL